MKTYLLMQGAWVPSLVGKDALWPKIPHALWPKKQNIKQKQYCSKFNEDFKKWSTLKKKPNSTPSYALHSIVHLFLESLLCASS